MRIDIERIEKLHNEIDNFRQCYKDNELWGRPEEAVSFEHLVEFLIEHPEFQEIADNISKLQKGGEG